MENKKRKLARELGTSGEAEPDDHVRGQVVASSTVC